VDDPEAMDSWLKLGFFKNLNERKSPRALGLELSPSFGELIPKKYRFGDIIYSLLVRQPTASRGIIPCLGFYNQTVHRGL